MQPKDIEFICITVALIITQNFLTVVLVHTQMDQVFIRISPILCLKKHHFSKIDMSKKVISFSSLGLPQ